MQELKGNLFRPESYLIQPSLCRGWVPAEITPDIICITTNGFVKKDGCAVMGRGCAQEAKNRYPNINKLLGIHINTKGNIPGILYKDYGSQEL